MSAPNRKVFDEVAETATGLRGESEPLKLMREACEAVGCAQPVLVWPSDLLQAPTVG